MTNHAFPQGEWPTANPTDMGLDVAQLEKARNFALTGEGSGAIIYRGMLVMSWGDLRAVYDLKSSTKSIGATALGLAMADGKMELADKAVSHHPTLGVPPESNKQTGWIEQITIKHLATQTAGFAKNRGYTELLFAPGTHWHYSDGGPNWLAECITLAYGEDLNSLMGQRVFRPIGIGGDDLRWRTNSLRPPTIDGILRREFGAGIHANVIAMARIGYLYLNDGIWNGNRILPAHFVETATQSAAENKGLPVYYDEQTPDRGSDVASHYGLLWWNNSDGTAADIPRDAYWSKGLYDSTIAVIPSRDLVITRAGTFWQYEPKNTYHAMNHFVGTIVTAIPG